MFFCCAEEPKVSTSPRVQNFAVGRTVTISCTAIAYPKPGFVWRRSGEVIDQSDRVTYDSDGLLTIHSAIKEDVGEWECLATNALGEGSGVAHLEFIGKNLTHSCMRDINKTDAKVFFV